MPQYQYVQIGFTDETLTALDEKADEMDISRSELVRQCVDSEL
jgi:metal-responsive CopG/Arc/MetJ family transcriptional regulator